MKIEIENVSNGYIITMPADDNGTEQKIVVEQKEDDTSHSDTIDEFISFNNLVENLQEIFGIYNSKHNTVGFISGICSEDKRWEFNQQMKESLKNPKNDLGD